MEIIKRYDDNGKIHIELKNMDDSERERLELLNHFTKGDLTEKDFTHKSQCLEDKLQHLELERLYQEAKEQQGNAYNENSLVEEPEEPCAKSCEETDEDDETYIPTISDEKNIVFLKADMYRIVNDYTKKNKAHNKLDETLDKIIDFFIFIGEGLEAGTPLYNKYSQPYNKYILPMINKQKHFSLATCILFASLLSSYIKADEKADSETSFIIHLLNKESFNPSGFFKWKREMQMHITKINKIARVAVINKNIERSKKKRDTEERNARKIKSVEIMNKKTREIHEKQYDIEAEIVNDAETDEWSFLDDEYGYFDSENVHIFKCYDDLLDFICFALRGKDNKYTNNEIEIKYGEISLLLNSLPYDKKNEQLNYYGDRIARIHTELLEYFKNYLTTLKRDMVKNKDGAMANVADFIVLHKKDCLKVNDESITVLVEELSNALRKHIEDNK